jgi:CBS domain-containing protein
LVQTEQPADLVEELDKGTLLIAGAPGGSWLQRQFFGPGRKLQTRAPAGTVVVRSAPQRAFHLLREPDAYLSPMLGSGDALRLLEYAVLPVAENGKLVGMVRRSALLLVGHGIQVGSIMEDPVAVTFDTPVDEIGEVGQALGGAPVPVIDDDGFLVGVVGP